MPKLIQKNSNRLSAQNRTPVNDYLVAKEYRNNRTWTLHNGEMKTIFNREYLSAKEFDKRFPVPKTINFYGDKTNPDKRNFYLLD